MSDEDELLATIGNLRAELAKVRYAVEWGPELDSIIAYSAVAAARIRTLHKPEGFGEEQHCIRCVRNGEAVYPCLTVKALDPWRWGKDGRNLYA